MVVVVSNYCYYCIGSDSGSGSGSVSGSGWDFDSDQIYYSTVVAAVVVCGIVSVVVCLSMAI